MAKDQDTLHTSMVKSIAENLRTDVLTGQIPPGERIKVRDLEERFGVSHTPIREALRQLEAEHLVTSQPHRGTVVADVGIHDLHGIWDLRRIIETTVAQRSATQSTKTDFDAAREAMDALEASPIDTDTAQFWELHSGFHWSLLVAGSTARIQRCLSGLWQASDRYIRLFVSHFAFDVDNFLAQHRALLDSYLTGNGDELSQNLAEHITATEDQVRTAILAIGEESRETTSPPVPG